MDRLVYLIGTNHGKGIKPNPELEAAIKVVEDIELEGVSNDNIDFFKALKEPLLLIAIYILFWFEKRASSLGEGRKDSASLLEIKNRIRGEEAKIIEECDSSLGEMLDKYCKWYDFPVQIFAIALLYIYLVFAFHNILQVITLTTNALVVEIVALLVSIFLITILRLGYFVLVETYQYRNMLVVARVKELIAGGHTRIMVVYGEAHVSTEGTNVKALKAVAWLLKGKTFKDLFAKEDIPTKIIKVDFE